VEKVDRDLIDIDVGMVGIELQLGAAEVIDEWLEAARSKFSVPPNNARSSVVRPSSRA
jgi:hypothetical protein